MMPPTKVLIDTNVYSRLLAQKPEFLSNAAFLSLVVSQALDGQIDKITSSPLTIPPSPPNKGGKELLEEVSQAVSTSKAVTSNKSNTSNACALPVEEKKAARKPKDVWAFKTVSADLVPEDLADVASKFVEWWAARRKHSVRTQSVAEREFRKLRLYPPSDQIKALDKAIAGGYMQLYEPGEFAPTHKKQAEPETKHPAYKVFKAADQGAEWDIPSATGGKGVLDPGALDQAEACPF